MGKRKDRVPEVIPTVTQLRGIDGAWDEPVGIGKFREWNLASPLVSPEEAFPEFMELIGTPPYVEGEDDNFDPVDKALHYNIDPSGIECIEVVRHRNFNVGNAIKYLWRAGIKEDTDRAVLDKHIEDLKKSIYYIEDEIDRLAQRRNVW